MSGAAAGRAADVDGSMWPSLCSRSSRLVESISQAAHRAQHHGITQLGADSRDMNLDGVGGDCLVPARHGLLQAFLGDNASRVESETLDNQPFAAGELHR